jgi:hypothetical protein
MRRPSLRLVATVAALGPVSLVLSHNLSFLAAYGDGTEAALLATGHDARWTSAVEAVIALSVLLGMLGLARLLALLWTARSLERASGTSATVSWRGLARSVLALWAWLLVVTAAWFLVQENVERLSIGEGLAGFGPLVEHGLWGPLLIIPAVTAIVALVGGLFRWGVAALRARIAAAVAARSRRRPGRFGRPASVDRCHPNVLARNLALRAPPVLLAA